MLAESNQHILLYYFLISPTDDDLQYPSFSRKDLALVTFGHRIASQLRAFFANFS